MKSGLICDNAPRPAVNQKKQKISFCSRFNFLVKPLVHFTAIANTKKKYSVDNNDIKSSVFKNAYYCKRNPRISVILKLRTHAIR